MEALRLRLRVDSGTSARVSVFADGVPLAVDAVVDFDRRNAPQLGRGADEQENEVERPPSSVKSLSRHAGSKRTSGDCRAVRL